MNDFKKFNINTNYLKSITINNNNNISLFQHVQQGVKACTILFIGVTHGEEPQGEYLINKFMEWLSPHGGKIKNNLLFIPCLNPHGKSVCTRGNKNGVDINRNFPTKNWKLTERNEFFGGESPASEIETQFLINVIKNYSPDLIYTIHAPFEVVNFDGPAREIATEVSRLTGYPVQEDIGYPTPGSFGTYAGIERNIPTITIELPENIDNETLWEQNKEAMLLVANYEPKKIEC